MEIVENQLESAARLQNILRDAGIESAVIGGLAVAVWASPRVTKDADLKVLLTREQAGRLISALPSDYKIMSSDPEADLRRLGFIFTEDRNQVRIDLLLSDLGFDENVIARRREIEPVPNLKIGVCTAEDLIIYKLLSTRAYDHQDAKNVVRRQGNNLDHDYVEYWLRQFEIALDDSTLVESYLKLKLAHS